MKGLFLGIDPGQKGAIGIVDQEGKYYAAHRWNKRNPRNLFDILTLIKDMVFIVYIEAVRIFPREETGFITRNQSLLVSSGIFQGWLLALGMTYVQIDPATWQSGFNLYRYKSNPHQHSPLTLARTLWPTAPLEHLADDGSAVALLLADLARQDHQRGLDRAALQAEVAKKKALRRRQARTLKKLEAQSAEESRNPW